MGAVPQKPARCTAPSATCAVGFGEELLLLDDEMPPATAGSEALNSAPTWCGAGRTAEDAS